MLRASTESIGEHLANYCSKFKNELFNREILYYRQLFLGEFSDADIDIVLTHLRNCDDNSMTLQTDALNKISELSYGIAVLVGKNKKFYIRKAVTVIGREASGTFPARVQWQVDLNLKDNHRVSKQHAVILWNYQNRQFEIKCISAKFPIRVNNNKVSHSDDPVTLENGSLICIGNEFFYFQLPVA